MRRCPSSRRGAGGEADRLSDVLLAERQTGRTDTNQIVNFDAGRDLTGQFVGVEITSASPTAFLGKLPVLSEDARGVRVEGS